MSGIARAGRTCQLVNLTLSSKREPRIGLDDANWEIVLNRYSRRCANCGRDETEVQFQQDHKIPRLRTDIPGGGDDLHNWQPLCIECNNFKSTSCRNCQMDCRICSWAFPETYAPIRLTGDIITRLRKAAATLGRDPHDFANAMLLRELSKELIEE